MPNFDALFQPITFNGIGECKNRVVMAPLTRLRADIHTQVLPDYAETYYKQRASAGLIIAEATNISENARGYAGSPGVFTDAQIEAWKKITKAVHDKGGKIVCQLWHTGVVGHESLHPGCPVLGPSSGDWGCRCNIVEKDAIVRGPCTPSREMTKAEIAQTIADYARATANCLTAGFDGVEVHAAHGYLICDFLFGVTNKRTDEYGCQNFENRSRFLFEVINACNKEAPGRVGVRISPYGIFNNICGGPDSHSFTKYVFCKLDKMNMAYVHLSEPDWAKTFPAIRSDKEVEWDPDWDLTEERYADLRACLPTTRFIGSGGYTAEKACARINRLVDAVAFGRPFIPNPDLVERIRNNWPLATFDPSASYFGGKEGYADYPTYLEQSPQASSS